MWVYLSDIEKDEPYIVGFYKPDGNWHPESDHDTAEQAAARVHYLNGGKEGG